MKAWSDEQVSAYLDGALQENLVANFESDLALDPTLRERLEAMRGADAVLRGAFDAPLDEPIPDRFRLLVEESQEPAAASDPPPAAVIDLATRRGRRNLPSFDWRIPLAASIALVAGWAGGMSTPGGRIDEHSILRADATAIDPDNPLHRLLDTTPSAEGVVLPHGDTFMPVLSFEAADGRFCREFELLAEEATSVGVACRGAESWRVEVLLAADDRESSTEGYVQASGYNAAALDAVISSLGAGDPLGPEAEAEAIAGGWRAR